MLLFLIYRARACKGAKIGGRHTHVYLTPLIKVPTGILKNEDQKKAECQESVTNDDMCICLYTTAGVDRQTDRQTDRQNWLNNIAPCMLCMLTCNRNCTILPSHVFRDARTRQISGDLPKLGPEYVPCSTAQTSTSPFFTSSLCRGVISPADPAMRGGGEPEGSRALC